MATETDRRFTRKAWVAGPADIGPVEVDASGPRKDGYVLIRRPLRHSGELIVQSSVYLTRAEALERMIRAAQRLLDIARSNAKRHEKDIARLASMLEEERVVSEQRETTR